VVASAPRLSPRLFAAVERHDDGARPPIAAVWRDVCATAERLELARPSYESVRRVVKAQRYRRARIAPTAEVVTDVMMRSRPPDALLDHIAGIAVAKR
jgi:hypothetical protein